MIRARRKKRIFLIMLGICLVILYLQLGLLPGDSRNAAIRRLREETHSNFSFSKALYIPFYGLSLYDFRLNNPDGTLIFACHKLTVNVRLVPFFRDKKIIISNVHLDDPVYDYVLEPPKKIAKEPPKRTRMSGQFQIPDIPDQKAPDLSAVEEGPNAFLPENVYLEQIQIHRGRVSIRKTPQSPVIENLSDINLRMGFQKPPRLYFDGSFNIGEKTYSSLGLRGLWNLASGEYQFNLDVRSKKIPDWLLQYQQNRFLVLREGRFQLNVALKSIEERRVLFHAKAQLGDSLIQIKQADYRGKMSLDTVGRFNFESRAFEAYKGTLELNDITIDNLAVQVPRLEKISGLVNFQPDLLSLKNIDGHFKNIHFDADGSIESFRDLNLNIAIGTQSGLAEILNLLPAEEKKFLADFTMDGDCKALTHVKGSLKNASTVSLEHQLLLENGSLRSKDGKIRLENISSQILSNQEGLKIKNARLESGGKNYTVNLFLPKDRQRSGDVALDSKDFSLRAKYKLSGDNAKIESANFKVRGASAQFHGDLQNFKEPYLNILGTLRADLRPALARFDNPALKSADPAGDLSGNFTLAGFWKDPLGWTFNIDSKIRSLSAWHKIHLDEVEAQSRMSGRMLSVPYLHATGYDGVINASLLFDLKKADTPFNGKIYLGNINVAALAKDLGVKKELSGTGVMQVNLSGALKSPQAVQGSGAVDVHGGKIFETDQFKAMGSLPLVKVEGLNLVTFTSLTSNFMIHNSRLWTDNLTLKSEPVDLSLQGSIGFNQTLDLVMNIRFSSSIIEGAFDAGGIAPFVVQQAGNFISEYKISGTLSAPKTEKIPASAGKTLTKGLSGIIQSVVQ